MRLAFAALLFPSLLAAAPEFHSGPAPVALIELFTSEGCSSCPPAEDWLARLRADPGLWQTFVPVSWHVTYWDRLGWPDKFADPAYTKRQYAYAAAWDSASVYTPCFVRAGREWRASAPVALPADASSVGELTVARSDSGQWTLTYAPPPSLATHPLRAEIAWLARDIASPVKSGENAGRTLHHDFLALRHAVFDLPVRSDPRTIEFSVPADLAPAALAAWVTTTDSLRPLQATGGWLTSP